jgi:hypothetical protein
MEGKINTERKKKRPLGKESAKKNESVILWCIDKEALIYLKKI